MKHFYESIAPHRIDRKDERSMFTFPELYKEVITKCRPGGTVVEVGTWVGQSLAFLSVEAVNSKKKINVVGIDYFEDRLSTFPDGKTVDQWGLFKKNLKPVWSKITVIKSLSYTAAKMFNDVDFVFIDADHSYEGVKKDLNAWWPAVSEHGIFAGHDINLPNVKKAVDEFVAQYGLFYTVQERCWVIRK